MNNEQKQSRDYIDKIQTELEFPRENNLAWKKSHSKVAKENISLKIELEAANKLIEFFERQIGGL